MSKRFKSSTRKRAVKKSTRQQLSLYPLRLETALGAALKTGRPPDLKRKKPVDNRRRVRRLRHLVDENAHRAGARRDFGHRPRRNASRIGASPPATSRPLSRLPPPSSGSKPQPLAATACGRAS